MPGAALEFGNARRGANCGLHPRPGGPKEFPKRFPNAGEELFPKFPENHLNADARCPGNLKLKQSMNNEGYGGLATQSEIDVSPRALIARDRRVCGDDHDRQLGNDARCPPMRRATR